MKITLIWVGKTQDKYLEEGIDTYIKRLKHYTQMDVVEIKDPKGQMAPYDLKQYEAKELLGKLEPGDHVVLLDEGGKQLDSVAFSEEIERLQLRSIKRTVFIIGGAFGFAEEVYQKSDMKLSLSKMTFSHRMVRLFFVEQLYRAFTIIRNEKYHNI